MTTNTKSPRKQQPKTSTEPRKTIIKNTNKVQENMTTNTKSLGKQQPKTPIEPMKVMTRNTNKAQESMTRNTKRPQEINNHEHQ
jgi:hypothetical protein